MAQTVTPQLDPKSICNILCLYGESKSFSCGNLVTGELLGRAGAPIEARVSSMVCLGTYIICSLEASKPSSKAF
jgi:hypothetical protein